MSGPISRFAGSRSWTKLALLCGVILLSACGRHEDRAPLAESITIFVATITRDAVELIAQEFRAETGIAIEVSPGPSSGLARQIEQGAPADLLLSADQPPVDHLASKGFIHEQRPLLGNRLVVVVPADSSVEFKELRDLADPRIRRLALAEEKVPAGEYAREALRNANVWEQVQDKVVGGTDVRVTLQLVERGADAGIVYHTDVLGNARVHVAVEVSPELHRPIRYPLVLLKRGADKEGARGFYTYLASEKAAEIFRLTGFEVAP